MVVFIRVFKLYFPIYKLPKSIYNGYDLELRNWNGHRLPKQSGQSLHEKSASRLQGLRRA